MNDDERARAALDEKIRAAGYAVVSVLAGAYRGRQEQRAMLLHAVRDEDRGGGGKALCGHSTDRLCDQALDGWPTCPRCARALGKRLGVPVVIVERAPNPAPVKR